MTQQPKLGLGYLIVEVPGSHTMKHTYHMPGRTLNEWSACCRGCLQNTQGHPCLQVDSNLQSQQFSSHRSTSWLQGYWDRLLFSLCVGDFCWDHVQIRWPSLHRWQVHVKYCEYKQKACWNCWLSQNVMILLSIHRDCLSLWFLSYCGSSCIHRPIVFIYELP